MASSYSYVSIIIFLLSHLKLLVLAQEQAYQTCPSSFNCGTLGVYSYPFTTIYYPGCGLCILNCTNPVSTISFAEHGPWYDIIYSFSHNSTFFVSDRTLLHVVNGDICDIFSQSFHLIPRSSPSIVFTIVHNESFWKCPKSYNISDQKKSNSTTRLIHACEDYKIYHDMDQEVFLPGCTLVLYPDQLIVETSDQCSHCISESGRCQDLDNNGFKCVNKKQGRRKRILLLGLGIVGGSIVIFVLLATVLRNLRKVKLGLLTFASRNISADATGTDLGKSKMYFSLPIFSDSELEEATNNFDSSNELGDGGYGTVYYGKLKDGREVAVKRLHERNYRQLEQFMNEIQILTSLRHHNLVSLYGCTSRRSKELLLVYEYVPNGTVADHLYGDQTKCGILTWPIRMSIAIETAAALSYLHASDIIHRDVKSTNILLDKNFRVKVADFGLSRLFPTDVTHISTNPQGTPGYLDPQYHQCYQLTGKSDVYSFGVVLIELISSLPAVDITRNEDEINLSYFAIKKIQCCAFSELVDPRLGFKSNSRVNRMTISVAELAFQCLQHKRELRPSMNEVLETLKSIESYDCEVVKAQKKGENGDKLKSQRNDDYVWLLSDAECCTSTEMNLLRQVGESSDLVGSEITSSSV